MRPTRSERMKYSLEKYLNKGGTSMFVSLLMAAILGFLALIVIRFLVILIFPHLDQFKDFWTDMWVTFLEMTDPGNMGEDSDSSPWIKIITIFSGFVGIILISMLIAFITTALDSMLYNFRKGRGKVIESNHTVILGWNERVIDIIRELIVANESEKYASVVILAEDDKEEMDDMLAKRLPNTKSTRIITTNGDYANINELTRININIAKSVIILAQCTESASNEEKSSSDIQTVKAIMAITSCQDGNNKLPIIAEIFGREKRDIVSYFEDDNIICIDSWEIMGKLLVQTSLTSGLEIVYNEMLAFEGSEFYFYNAKWNSIKFKDIAYHLKDGIPLGYYNEKDGLQLRPDPERVMLDDDDILALADDNSTLVFNSSRLYKTRDVELANKKLDQKSKKVLILGWHGVAEIFIRELYGYIEDSSVIDIIFDKPGEELKDRVKELKKEYPRFKISLIDSCPLRLEELEKTDPFSYDNILILSQNSEDMDADKIDSDTIIILLLLRKIKKQFPEEQTNIITQVLNSENQDIINQAEVDDFIISNKLITMILAQLSEQPKIKILYDTLFAEEGSEIYVKPASLYLDSFPQKLSFADIISLAGKREEICLGIRKGNLCKNSTKNFGVRLNFPKDEIVELTEDDFLVVLSDDHT